MAEKGYKTLVAQSQDRAAVAPPEWVGRGLKHAGGGGLPAGGGVAPPEWVGRGLKLGKSVRTIKRLVSPRPSGWGAD